MRYTGSSPSRTDFSPRVVARLLARLEKISKAQKEIDEQGNGLNDEARDGHHAKKGGRAGQVSNNHARGHTSNNGNRHVHWTDNNSFPVNGHYDDPFCRKTWPNDSHLAEYFSGKLSIHKTSQKDSSLGAPVLSRRKEELNGQPSTTALRALSLVEG